MGHGQRTGDIDVIKVLVDTTDQRWPARWPQSSQFQTPHFVTDEAPVTIMAAIREASPPEYDISGML